jgi:hypothetical protein
MFPAVISVLTSGDRLHSKSFLHIAAEELVAQGCISKSNFERAVAERQPFSFQDLIEHSLERRSRKLLVLVDDADLMFAQSPRSAAGCYASIGHCELVGDQVGGSIGVLLFSSHRLLRALLTNSVNEDTFARTGFPVVQRSMAVNDHRFKPMSMDGPLPKDLGAVMAFLVSSGAVNMEEKKTSAAHVARVARVLLFLGGATPEGLLRCVRACVAAQSVGTGTGTGRGTEPESKGLLFFPHAVLARRPELRLPWPALTTDLFFLIQQALREANQHLLGCNLCSLNWVVVANCVWETHFTPLQWPAVFALWEKACAASPETTSGTIAAQSYMSLSAALESLCAVGVLVLMRAGGGITCVYPASLAQLFVRRENDEVSLVQSFRRFAHIE